jgi:hypothetical protein
MKILFSTLKKINSNAIGACSEQQNAKVVFGLKK